MRGSGAPGNSARAAARSPPCRSDPSMSVIDSAAVWGFGFGTTALAFLALTIEALVGYPDRLLRAIGHPVIWIGALIGALDNTFNRDGASGRGRATEGSPP